MTIQQIVKFKTTDKKEFETLEEAEAWEAVQKTLELVFKFDGEFEEDGKYLVLLEGRYNNTDVLMTKWDIVSVIDNRAFICGNFTPIKWAKLPD